MKNLIQDNIRNAPNPIQNHFIYREPETMTHLEGKRKSTDANPKMTRSWNYQTRTLNAVIITTVSNIKNIIYTCEK